MESYHSKNCNRRQDSDSPSSEYAENKLNEFTSPPSSFWKECAKANQQKEKAAFKAQQDLVASIERSQQLESELQREKMIQEHNQKKLFQNPFVKPYQGQQQMIDTRAQPTQGQTGQYRRSQQTFMQHPMADNPMEKREQYALELRQIKKQSKLKQRRKQLKFNPPQPVKRPTPGTFSRYHAPPLTLIHELLKRDIQFKVILDRKNYSDTVLVALNDEEALEHSGEVLQIINDNYLKNDHAFRPATKEEPVALQLGYEDLLRTTSRIQKENHERYFIKKWTSKQIQNSYVPYQKPLPWEKQNETSSEDDTSILIQQMTKDFKKMNFRQHLSRSKSAQGLTRGNKSLEFNANPSKKAKKSGMVTPKAKQ